MAYFKGSEITSDGGLLAIRELDETMAEVPISQKNNLLNRINNMLRKTITAMCIIVCLNLPGLSEITLDANFESGHLVKGKVFGNTVNIGPLNSDKELWYNFRIKGVKHQSIDFVVEYAHQGTIDFASLKSNDAAMVSYDGKGYEIVNDVQPGAKNPGSVSGNYVRRFSHTFREEEAFVSYCVPYTNTMLAVLSEKIQNNPNVTINKIGDSKFKKLPVTYFRITDKAASDAPKKKIFIMGREDSYEVGGSWAVEGITRFILSDDPVAKEMLKKMVFYIFPIFSVDGVAGGWTNYPLTADGSNYLYVTATWNKPEALPEVKLMKAFFEKLKVSGEKIDVSFRHHASCYWRPFVQGEVTKDTKENKEIRSELNKLVQIEKNNLFWYEKDAIRDVEDRFSWFIAQIFPKVLTFAYHNDFIINKKYAKEKKEIVRRNEDILCDGELIARALGEYFGIETKEAAPYIMASDVDKNCGKKGEVVTFSAYYYDQKGLAPEKVEININGKPYKMEVKAVEGSKFTKFQYSLVLNEPINNYYLTASNGKKERKIPQDDYLLPGPFIIE